LERAVDQHAADQPRCNSKEMRSVAPGHATQIDHADINLVHEGCGLEGVADPLARHVPLRSTMQFLVDKRGQLLERL
jgi:hypothetical protein